MGTGRYAVTNTWPRCYAATAGAHNDDDGDDGGPNKEKKLAHDR